ncbi:MAG: T9SS type A sorting domain-containing protein [Bacteroidota bacterium]|nr:T9SS type A sorting domain-containing protein [Bacteroidota bacterium]
MVINYNEPVYLPNLLQSMPAWGANSITSEHSNILHVFPNPAGSYFIIEHDLRETYGESILRLSDERGRLISTIEIPDKQNQRVINAGSLSSGIYIVQLFMNNNLIETHKVEIAR